MRCIIAGSRQGFSLADVNQALEKSGFAHLITEVVSGGARGVDRLGEAWARQRKIEVKQFIPDWEKHKKAAGPLRNQAMAEYADALILVWDGASKGSRSMLENAQRLGLKVYEYKVSLRGYRRD